LGVEGSKCKVKGNGREGAERGFKVRAGGAQRVSTLRWGEGRDSERAERGSKLRLG
jgi:hypothetical protein